MWHLGASENRIYFVTGFCPCTNSRRYRRNRHKVHPCT